MHNNSNFTPSRFLAPTYPQAITSPLPHPGKSQQLGQKRREQGERAQFPQETEPVECLPLTACL
ncbi:hypothetical protein BVRB_8g186670 [Beta vulgaris subsp. vulgaris]|nr:hypothetical protein BVRB_8g186670 [Beta vulgaris subsp. vulgaris]